MRYSASINVTRKSRPRIAIIAPPSTYYPAEVRVDFGGLFVWFSEEEATDLGRNLIEAGIRIRHERKESTDDR